MPNSVIDLWTNRLDMQYHALMDMTENLSQAAVAEWLNGLIHLLAEAQRSLNDVDWRSYCQACRRHPIATCLREDPFLARAFDKPRGYAGDAVLLDMIYSLEAGIPPTCRRELTRLGHALFLAYQSRDSCAAVRRRRDYVASLLNELPHGGRALSIACGHLREAALVVNNQVEIVALDQDQESLREVRRSVDERGSGPRVTTIHAKIADIIKGRVAISGKFDLVYSAGLYDYLDDQLATGLTNALLNYVSETGLLCIGNFTERIEMPFCDIFQDWKLIARDQPDLERLGGISASGRMVSTDIDEFGGIVWLRIGRTNNLADQLQGNREFGAQAIP